MRDATARHIRSALRRLPQGGRLVALTHSSHNPTESDIAGLYREPGFDLGFAFTATVDGRIYARHGTSVDTRLTVIDRMPRPEPPVTAGHARTLAELLALIDRCLPQRAPAPASPAQPSSPAALRPPPGRSPAPRASAPLPAASTGDAAELAYEARELSGPAAQFNDRIYEPYDVQSIVIAGAKPHPTKLVQSAAMASVRAPIPSYRPLLPRQLVSESVLSDAQLETIIYAGEAHAEFLPARYRVDETLDNLSLACEDDTQAVQFRKGFFLGDGTGAGKGRQAAGIVLDNWLKGRRKAVWISKSDKLLEDAQRDWSALGQEKLFIVPQSRFRQGTPIQLSQGILFTTYATLRSSEREGKASRLKQMLDWLAPISTA